MTDSGCVLCARPLAEDEPQTCRRCAGRVLGDLAWVERLHPLLSVELAGRVGAGRTAPGSGDGLPMGDLLSLLGPGANVACRDAQPDDAPSVVGTLAGWEDDWRQTRGLPGAPGPATVESASAFLRANNGWAAQRHPAYHDFAAEVRDLLGRIKAALRLTDTPVVTPVHCIETLPADDGPGTVCGGRLVRDYDPPRPCSHGGAHRSGCDQGGLRDQGRCEDCGRLYSRAELHVAFHEQLAEAQRRTEQREAA